MIQATLPQKVSDPRLLVVTLVYAAMLAVLALLQLVGFGGFDFAGIQIETQGPVAAIIALAAAEIFALPFVLRLKLSPLARACSAVLSLLAPLLYLSLAIFIRDQTLYPITSIELIVGALMGILAISSFNVLSGDQTLRFGKNSK